MRTQVSGHPRVFLLSPLHPNDYYWNESTSARDQAEKGEREGQEWSSG